jgi:hypothetical protein
MTYLANSIHIAGKNSFLTSNLMFSTAEYFMENSSETSKVDSAIVLLESNILTLKDGGKISGIDLKHCLLISLGIGMMYIRNGFY